MQAARPDIDDDEAGSTQEWATAAESIFSDAVSGRIGVLLRHLGASLSYYDWKGGPSSRVSDYMRALNSKMDELKLLGVTDSSPSEGHELELSEFAEACRRADGTGVIWFNADLLWSARAETPDGMHVLANSNGETGYPRLEGLMSLLAGVGVRSMRVEWDGFPAFYLDKVN